MPFDTNYIQNTLASQNAMFAQNLAISQNLSYQNEIRQVGGNAQPVAVPSIPPPPPPPPNFGVSWGSGMDMSPMMASQPRFTSPGGMVRGLLGMTPDPFQMSPGAMQRAAKSQLGGLGSDIFYGAMGGIGRSAGDIANTLGWMGGGAIGSGIGSMFTGAIVGEGAGALANLATAPLRGASERYSMAKTLSMEFGMDPRLSRIPMGQGNFMGMARSLQQSANQIGPEGEPLGMGRTLELVGMAKQGGQFDLAKNSGDIEKTIKDYIAGAKNIAKMLKVTVQEGGQLMNELKQMGFFDIGSQVNQLKSMTGAANMAGMGMGQMMQIAGMGRGITGTLAGATQATSMTARTSFLERQSVGNYGMIQRMGGITEASMSTMAAGQNFMENTGWGTLAMARGLSGGGGVGGGSYNTAMFTGKMDPRDIMKMINPYARKEMVGKMGGPAAAWGMIQDVQRSFSKMPGMGDLAKDVNFLSQMTGMSPDQIRLYQAQNTPEAKAEERRNIVQAKRVERDELSMIDEGATRSVFGAARFFGAAMKTGAARRGSKIDEWVGNLGSYAFGGATGQLSNIWKEKMTGEAYNVRGKDVGVSNLSSRELSERASMASSAESSEGLMEKAKDMEKKVLNTGGILGLFGGTSAADLDKFILSDPVATKEYQRLLKGENSGGTLTGILIKNGMSPGRAKALVDKITANRGTMAEAQKLKETGSFKENEMASLMGDLGGVTGKLQGAATQFAKKGDRAAFQEMRSSFFSMSKSDQKKAAAESAIIAGMAEGGRGENVDTAYKKAMSLAGNQEIAAKKDSQAANMNADTIRIQSPQQVIFEGGSRQEILGTDASANLNAFAAKELRSTDGSTYNVKGN